ncbi:hypothetical protein RCL_jg13326.t1 [Rhizophagus clarus]|uniref:Uncharacterized protein n=1 Tax=Rhizophagus clarus TaxID=94130 RepID=A0A8H3LQ78_9GLOM|nr:hypothetical protein RCL_jg13326.t1 [Rhizophagus clarus]
MIEGLIATFPSRRMLLKRTKTRGHHENSERRLVNVISNANIKEKEKHEPEKYHLQPVLRYLDDTSETARLHFNMWNFKANTSDLFKSLSRSPRWRSDQTIPSA